MLVVSPRRILSRANSGPPARSVRKLRTGNKTRSAFEDWGL
jgi:hypothetical protein